MATMQQLTGGTPEPQVSSSVTQVSGVGSANYRSGESLANDLMKIMGEGVKTAQTYITGSKEAAKRVASDTNVKLNKFISNVEASTNFNDPKSLAEAQKEIALKQAELSDVEFDLEDAQNAFDDNYTKPAAVNVARINSKLKLKELNLIDIELYNDTINNLNEGYKVGNKPTYEGLQTEVEKITASKRVSKDNGWYSVAGVSTTAFNNKITTNEGLATVLSDGKFKGTWDLQTKQNVFKNEFGAYGHLDENGEIVFKEGIGKKAEDEIRRNWLSFNNTMKPKKGTVLNPFKDLNARVTTNTSNQTSKYTPSNEMTASYNENVKLFKGVASTKEYKPTHFDDAQRNLKKQLNSVRITKSLEKKVLPLIYDKTKAGELAELLKRNFTVEYEDALTNSTNKATIAPSKIKEIIAYEKERIQNTLNTLDMKNKNAQGTYRDEYKKLRHLETLTGDGSSSLSSITTQAKNIVELKPMGVNVSTEQEAIQLITQVGVLGDPEGDDSATARILHAEFLREYELWKQQPEKDRKISDLIMGFEKVRSRVKTRQEAPLKETDVKDTVKKYYNEEYSGYVFGIGEEDKSHASEDQKQLTMYAMSNVVSGTTEEKLEKIEWIDLGTNFLGAKDVTYPSIGCKVGGFYSANCKTRTKGAVEAMIKDSKYSKEQVEVRYRWIDGNWELSLYEKGRTDNHIGTITSRNMSFWYARGF